MAPHQNLIFTAEPITDGTFGKRYNLYVRTKDESGRGGLFGTLRRLSDTGWNLASDDGPFRDHANENLGMWMYRHKRDVTVHDMLFIAKVSYITWHYALDLEEDQEQIDEALTHGTKKDVQEALGMK